MKRMLRAGTAIAALWVGIALAQASVPTPPAAEVGSCAEAEASLAAMASVPAEQRALADALCGAGSERPRHDPQTEQALAQWHQANLAATTRHLRGLMASTDPRDQLAAAIIAPVVDWQSSGDKPDESSFEWASKDAATAFAAARRLGPDDRLVAWMEATDCPGVRAGCDPRGAMARLQRSEPDNAAAWLMALPPAGTDPAETDRLLSKAAAAARYETPFNQVGLLLYQALAGVAAPPMAPRVAEALGADVGLGRAANARDMAALSAMAMTTAVAMPAYGALQSACMGGDGAAAALDRRANCLAVYARMTQDESLLAQVLALTNLVRLGADGPEGARWRERLRETHWLQQHGSAQMAAGIPLDYLPTMWRDGEITAFRRLLAAAGKPTSPPPGWLPEDPRLRGLVTTRNAPVVD